MIRNSITTIILIGTACFAHAVSPASRPSAGTRYATDAYPGFDTVDEVVTSVKKTPRWFSWFTGPKKNNAADQLAWGDECAAEKSWGAARKAYDALVREWPASAEASKAQEKLAGIYLDADKDCMQAFEEYKYLLDYYPSECAYDVIAKRLYDVACTMKIEGKKVMFFRFANTTDVRRAFEAVVLRAPGATYAPRALLTIASLREDDGEYEKAVQVYENLRNGYSKTPEAAETFLREAAIRMKLLDAHGSNRSRCADTVSFLRFALASETDVKSKKILEDYLSEAVNILEKEAYEAACFYDSKTRTRRSAINAYEKFLSAYPASAYAEKARARLIELQGESK